MKHLTIVIPSYNTEKFIDKNINTFIDDRIFNDVEILIINDGSKDGTAIAAKKYEEKYPGFIRLINKENGGHGSVINRGIQEATGRYFKVIDADDWVETDNLVKLVNNLKECEEDLVLNPFIKIDQNTGKKKICKFTSMKFIENNYQFEQLIKSDLVLALHSVTYKTEILRVNNIRVTEKCFYEDFQYVLYPLIYIRTVCCLEYPVYYYLVGQKSQSVNAENSLKNIPMYCKVFEDSVLYFEKVKTSLNISIRKYMESCISEFLRSLYNIYLRNGQVNNIMDKFLITDKRIKGYSDFFYNKVGSDNKYISIMRRGNRFVFKVLSLMFRLCKIGDVS